VSLGKKVQGVNQPARACRSPARKDTPQPPVPLFRLAQGRKVFANIRLSGGFLIAISPTGVGQGRNLDSHYPNWYEGSATTSKTKFFETNHIALVHG